MKTLKNQDSVSEFARFASSLHADVVADRIGQIQLSPKQEDKFWEAFVGNWLCETTVEEFDWLAELMFESPAFIKHQLERLGDTLSDKEVEELQILLLCRLGILSQRGLDRSQSAKREIEILKELTGKRSVSD